MKNKLKEKMVNDEKTLGSFHVLGSESVVEILGYAGFDYVLLDTEHGPFDVEKAQSLIRSAKLSGTTRSFIGDCYDDGNVFYKLTDSRTSKLNLTQFGNANRSSPRICR